MNHGRRKKTPIVYWKNLKTEHTKIETFFDKSFDEKNISWALAVQGIS